MNILIAGASGFVGTELVRVLEKVHAITVLGRSIELLGDFFGTKPVLRQYTAAAPPL